MDTQLNERLYQSVVQNIGVGIIKHDTDGRIILSNKAALDMLGLSEDELYGKTSIDPSWNVINENGSDFPGNTHPVFLAIATEKAVKDVVMGVHRPTTKDRVWLLVNAEPQFDDNGHFMNVLVAFTDISAYKKVQDELHIKNNILHSIHEFSQDVITIVDGYGNFLYTSMAITKISGYSSEDILKKNVFSLLTETEKIAMKALFQEVMRVGEVQNVLGKGVCKDGTVKHVSRSFRWNEKTRLIYVNVRDVTETVKAAEKLAQQQQINEQNIKKELIKNLEIKRNKIAYELHENVAQQIASAKMYLDLYEKGATKEVFHQVKSLMVSSIEVLKHITYQNNLPNFNEVGLASALEVLLNTEFMQTDVVHALTFSVDEAIIRQENSLVIYRVLQYLFHFDIAKTDIVSVLIEINADDTKLYLSIINEIKATSSYKAHINSNLAAIKERLSIYNGTFQLSPLEDEKSIKMIITLDL